MQSQQHAILLQVEAAWAQSLSHCDRRREEEQERYSSGRLHHRMHLFPKNISEAKCRVEGVKGVGVGVGVVWV